MRRKDREITDLSEIFDILTECDTIRLAINGSKHPYCVPLSFGAEQSADVITVFFHCAGAGVKVDLIKDNPYVCVEGDIFIKTDRLSHGITTRYKSVMGFGVCEFLTDKSEIIHGLSLINSHYGYSDYNIEQCGDLSRVLVGKIVIDKIYGKKNLPEQIK